MNKKLAPTGVQTVGELVLSYLDRMSPKSQISSLDEASFMIGAIEMYFNCKRELRLHHLKSYLTLCDKLKNRPDINIMEYAVKVYGYEYKNGQHCFTIN